MSSDQSLANKGKTRTGRFRRSVIAAAAVVSITVLGALWIKHNLYASPYTPTRLNEQEHQVLENKLKLLEDDRLKSPVASGSNQENEEVLEPEPYREDPAKRTIIISERELNALIASNEETARRVALDLSRDLVSVMLLIPLDKDLPVLGGITLRLHCGITLGYEAGRPVVALRGVSVGGIPLPDSWLGNIKNVDLAKEFAGRGGFWDAFSEGVQDIKVSDGSLHLMLRE